MNSATKRLGPAHVAGQAGSRVFRQQRLGDCHRFNRLENETASRTFPFYA